MAFIGSTAFAQRGGHGGGGFIASQVLLDQLEKQNTEQKNSNLADAKRVADHSDSMIKKLQSQLKKLEQESEGNRRALTKCETSLDECESEIRANQKERAVAEERTIAEQDESSPYEVALKQVRDVEKESTRQAERVLGHPVRDGSPDILLSVLKKNEFKTLEGDKEWSRTFSQYKKNKAQVAEEAKRLFQANETITQLDETISKLTEDRKKQKAERVKLHAKQAKITNEIKTCSLNLEEARNRLDGAKLAITQITGK